MSKIIIPDHCTLITGRYLWRAIPDASAALHQGRPSSPPEEWTAMRDSDDDGDSDSYPWEICATDSPEPPLPPFASTRVEPWPHSEAAVAREFRAPTDAIRALAAAELAWMPKSGGIGLHFIDSLIEAATPRNPGIAPA